MRFLHVARIDAEFYKLGIPAIPERVYFYLSARCGTRFHVSEAEIVAALRINIKRVRASIVMLCEMKMLKRWVFPRPFCTEYLVTGSTEKGWGIGLKRAYLMGFKRALLRGSNEPHDGVQTSPPPTTINCDKPPRAHDSENFVEFKRRFSKWHWNRRDGAGSAFHFTAKLETLALHCFNWLCSNHLFESYADLWLYMDHAGEYLALPRDVLDSTGKRDNRAHTPPKWLGDWAEQVRLSKIYHDEKLKKVTRMPKTEEES